MTITHTPSSFEAHLRSKGYLESTQIEREAGFRLGDHIHPFDACALIVQGDICLQVGSLETQYQAGDIFELKRDTLHQEWVGEQGVIYVVGRKT